MNSFLLGSQDQPTSSPVLLYIKPSPTGWPFSFTLLLIFRVIKQKHCQRHCRPRRSLLLPNLQLDWRKNLIVAICTHLNNFIASLDSCNKLWAALTAVTTCSQLWQLLQSVSSFDGCYKLFPSCAKLPALKRSQQLLKQKQLVNSFHY